jgi:multiple sugar transport system substrate-binding protein
VKLHCIGRASVVLTAILGFGAPVSGAGKTEITMWSNWPDEPAKKELVASRIHDFEAASSDCSVKLSFIPKADIYTQAKSAVRTYNSAIAHFAANLKTGAPFETSPGGQS